MTPMKIVLGIGNPGKEYERTRHNVGWLVLDHMVQGLATFEKTKWPLHMATLVHPTVGKVLLVKPMTFVNRSGQAAQALCSYYQVPCEDLLILSDDIHLGLGTLRLRGEGGHGGHNGLRDIIAHLGKGMPRLRFGVGKPHPGADQIGHVLGAFSAEEQADLQLGIEKAAKCVELWLVQGLQSAMSCNGPLRPPPLRPKPPHKQPEPTGEKAGDETSTKTERSDEKPTDG